MNTDTTSAMQEALQAAVKRMNNGPVAPEPPPMPTDPISMLMAIIPKLLQNNDERDDLVEKVNVLQKEDIAGVRTDVQVLRKQLHRIARMQEETLLELREVQKHQLAISEAVLDLAAQMARVEIVTDAPAESSGGYERMPAAVPSRPGRGRGTMERDGRQEMHVARK